MLNVSIVLYKNTPEELRPLVETLLRSSVVSEIYLIDNSPNRNADFEKMRAHYHFTGKNLGYGAAHNIAIRKSIEQNTPYHLVVNPDISFDESILGTIVTFMNNNSKIGQIMPKIFYPNREIQYLCKLIPTPADLIFRRFLPSQWTKKRTEKFELRASGYNKLMDVPYLSGCFMLLKTEALKKVGMFDERFFMYPEDIDLTRRIHRKYRTIYFPDVHVIHHHAQSSYKSIKMLLTHASNMIKYFNKWGWVFDSERKEVNKKIIKQINKPKTSKKTKQ